MTIRIGSFLTRSGVPADDIPSVTPGYPTIRIWQLDPVAELVVGTPDGSGQNTDGVMTLLEDGTQHDGFYFFDFTEAMGYAQNASYLIRVDGGSSLGAGERYQANSVSANVVSLVNSDITNIVNGVLDETLASHTIPGSVADTIKSISNSTDQLLLGVVDLLDIISVMQKYNTNRTRIDTTSKQLVIYDNDGTSVLRIFQLLDANGSPSIESIAERVPIFATDGMPGGWQVSHEQFTAVLGESIFTLTNPYVPSLTGIGLMVFVDGVKQIKGLAYDETSPTTVTFLGSPTSFVGGEIVEFYILSS